MTEENKNKEVVNEEDLSKAIDDLIDEHFSGGGDEDMEKGNGQPENKMDELPKDTDVKANGGKDVIKAKEGVKEDEEEEEEEKKEEKESMEYSKGCKKSEEATNDKYETLQKAFGEEKEKNEVLQKSFNDLKKGFEDLTSVINEKFDSAGEIFKGLKYEIDTLKKTPNPRNSIKSVDQIKKSFHDSDKQEEGQNFTKSEVGEAIDSLVKAGKISSTVGTEFELYGKISQPHVGKVVAAEVLKNRK